MNLKSGICSQCGAQLEQRPGQKKMFCPYCGAEYFPEESKPNAPSHINWDQSHHTTTIQQTTTRVGKKGMIESILDYKEHQKQMEIEEERREEEEEQRRKERARQSRKRFRSWLKRSSSTIFAILLAVILSVNILDFFHLTNHALLGLILTILFSFALKWLFLWIRKKKEEYFGSEHSE